MASSWRASEIRDFMFLGNEYDAHNVQALREHKITHILNVADDVFTNNKEEFVHCHLPVLDHGKDIGISRVFNDALIFVQSMKRTPNGRILIHCRKGINRSVTITVALLMMLENLSLKQAWIDVKTSRAIAGPHKTSRQELMNFELQTTNIQTIPDVLAFYKLKEIPSLNKWGVP